MRIVACYLRSAPSQSRVTLPGDAVFLGIRFVSTRGILLLLYDTGCAGCESQGTHSTIVEPDMCGYRVPRCRPIFY